MNETAGRAKRDHPARRGGSAGAGGELSAGARREREQIRRRRWARS